MGGVSKNWGEIRPYCAYLLLMYSENLRDHKNTVKMLMVSFKMVLTNRCQNIEKCARTPLLKRTNRAINMHSRGLTEQCFCVLEPLH